MKFERNLDNEDSENLSEEELEEESFKKGEEIYNEKIFTVSDNIDSDELN
jgi:hypothetical protein